MQHSDSAKIDLQDVQGESDSRGIAIDRVGIRGLRLPVTVRTRNGGTLATVATVELTVELPPERKGTHMSRFVELIHSERRPLDDGVLAELLPALCGMLNSTAATVILHFPFFMEKRAPVTAGVGFVDYDVVLKGVKTGDFVEVTKTVIVPVTTLCPCSKAISIHGAHNQRGEVKFSARAMGTLAIEDLIEMTEGCASSELYSLLKRPDEKAVTERAFLHPVFVEDLVRNLASVADSRAEIRWYRVEAENFESIHSHNAYAELERER